MHFREKLNSNIVLSLEWPNNFFFQMACQSFRVEIMKKEISFHDWLVLTVNNPKFVIKIVNILLIVSACIFVAVSAFSLHSFNLKKKLLNSQTRKSTLN